MTQPKRDPAPLRLDGTCRAALRFCSLAVPPPWIWIYARRFGDAFHHAHAATGRCDEPAPDTGGDSYPNYQVAVRGVVTRWLMSRPA